MITGSGSKTALTSKNILLKISDYDVYRYYLGYDFIPKKTLISPFRPETRGSFNIYYNESGYLRHLDYGDSYYKGNCFQFVQQLYGLDYNNALKKINVDFNLGLGGMTTDENIHYGSIVKNFIKPKEYDQESESRVTIHVQARAFTTSDLEYWNQFGITEHELNRNNIYSVDKLYLNGKYIGNYQNQLRFAYLFQSDQGETYFKIYQPLSKEYKWISNVPVKKPLGLGYLPRNSKNLIISKSKKDKMILEKLHPDVYEVQKEGEEVIPEELVNLFYEWYDHVYVFYDNDDPGIKASMALNHYGFEWINIPNEYKMIGIKDAGDMMKEYGPEQGLLRLQSILDEKMCKDEN